MTDQNSTENVYTTLQTISLLANEKKHFYCDSAGLFELLVGAGWVTGRFWGRNPEGQSIYEDVLLTPRGREVLDRWHFTSGNGEE